MSKVDEETTPIATHSTRRTVDPKNRTSGRPLMIPQPTPIETTEDEPSQPTNQDAVATQHPEEQPEYLKRQVRQKLDQPSEQSPTYNQPKPDKWNAMSFNARKRWQKRNKIRGDESPE